MIRAVSVFSLANAGSLVLGLIVALFVLDKTGNRSVASFFGCSVCLISVLIVRSNGHLWLRQRQPDDRSEIPKNQWFQFSFLGMLGGTTATSVGVLLGMLNVEEFRRSFSDAQTYSHVVLGKYMLFWFVAATISFAVNWEARDQVIKACTFLLGTGALIAFVVNAQRWMEVIGSI